MVEDDSSDEASQFIDQESRYGTPEETGGFMNVN